MKVTVGEGRHRVTLEWLRQDRGLVAAISGGESGHVGAVVLSAPRPSLTGSGISCDSWVVPLPGHKDHLLAQPAAEALCRLLGEPVSVTAGVHVDDADPEDLRLLNANFREALNQALDRLGRAGDGSVEGDGGV